MTAYLKSEQLQQSIVEGFPRYQYTRVYEVNDDSLFDALADPGIPALGSELIVSGIRTWCIDRVPQRSNDDTKRSQIFVSCRFTNESQSFERTNQGIPTDDPADIAPLVQEQWDEVEVPVKYAELKGIVNQFDQFVLPPTGLGTYSEDAVTFTYKGVIINSALEPLLGYTRKQSRLRLTFWTWHRNWTASWGDLINTTNGSTVTISESDEDGVRSQRTFAAGELFLANIFKEQHWKEAKLWFRRGLELIVSTETYKHNLQVPDVGLSELIYVDQYKSTIWQKTPSDKTKYTETDLEEMWGTDGSSSRKRNMPIRTSPFDDSGNFDPNGMIPIVEPVRLNGYGRQYHFHRPEDIATRPDDGSFSLRYQIYQAADWSTLNIA